MKRLLSVLVVILFIISMTSCGKTLEEIEVPAGLPTEEIQTTNLVGPEVPIGTIKPEESGSEEAVEINPEGMVKESSSEPLEELTEVAGEEATSVYDSVVFRSLELTEDSTILTDDDGSYFDLGLTGLAQPQGQMRIGFEGGRDYSALTMHMKSNGNLLYLYLTDEDGVLLVEETLEPNGNYQDVTFDISGTEEVSLLIQAVDQCMVQIGGLQLEKGYSEARYDKDSIRVQFSHEVFPASAVVATIRDVNGMIPEGRVGFVKYIKPQHNGILRFTTDGNVRTIEAMIKYSGLNARLDVYDEYNVRIGRLEIEGGNAYQAIEIPTNGSTRIQCILYTSSEGTLVMADLTMKEETSAKPYEIQWLVMANEAYKEYLQATAIALELKDEQGYIPQGHIGYVKEIDPYIKGRITLDLNGDFTTLRGLVKFTGDEVYLQLDDWHGGNETRLVLEGGNNYEAFNFDLRNIDEARILIWGDKKGTVCFGEMILE